MGMFERGYTPGLLCRELVKNISAECKIELKLHKALADRSKTPRRRDFNQLYKKHGDEDRRSKNLASMFKKLEENVDELLKTKYRHETKDECS